MDEKLIFLSRLNVNNCLMPSHLLFLHFETIFPKGLDGAFWLNVSKAETLYLLNVLDVLFCTIFVVVGPVS